MYKETITGLLDFITIGVCVVFLFTFVFHVIFTPREDKIREIIREELSQFKENSESQTLEEKAK